MSNLAVKRITGDMRNYYKSGLNDCGIYCEFNEDNIYKVKVLIMGPADTPYAHGNYFFDLTYPVDYPINPPKVLLRTQGLSVRFNPNLYTNGKVCLSILGTWNGPGWTSCCSLNTVLLSIQSLMNENPIHNEPGWENIKDSRSDSYNNIIRYANVAIATIGMMETPVPRFEGFLPVMLINLIKNRKYFDDYLHKHKDDTEKELYSQIYQLRIKPYYNNLLSRYTTIIGTEEAASVVRKTKAAIAAAAAEKRAAESLSQAAESQPQTAASQPQAAASQPQAAASQPQAAESEAASQPQAAASQPQAAASQQPAKKYTRKCPNGKASTYESGYKKKSENDGNMWIVLTSAAGVNLWKKIKKT